MGKTGTLVGQLAHARQGQREFSTFAYDPQWLSSPERFEVSPDLPLVAGFQARRQGGHLGVQFLPAPAFLAPDQRGLIRQRDLLRALLL